MIYDQTPLYKLCSEDPDVIEHFGNNPVRIFSGGEAPQNTVTPYAVYQDIAGVPESYLSGRPDTDSFTIQISVVADTQEQLREAAESIIRAIECHSTISHGPRFKDPELRKYRVSFDADFINCRGKY